VTQYILFDSISWQLGLFYVGVGATASILGQCILYIQNLITKRGNYYYNTHNTRTLTLYNLRFRFGVFDGDGGGS